MAYDHLATGCGPSPRVERTFEDVGKLTSTSHRERGRDHDSAWTAWCASQSARIETRRLIGVTRCRSTAPKKPLSSLGGSYGTLLDAHNQGEQRDPHTDEQRQQCHHDPSADEPVGTQTLDGSGERVGAKSLHRE